jgi:HK97 family phage prohead protease
MKKLEMRHSFQLHDPKLEVRSSTDGSARTIEGVALPYGQVSDGLVYGEFYEMVMQGAFRECLNDPKLDVLVDWCHQGEDVIPLGRFRAQRAQNTLTINEEMSGLRFSVAVGTSPSWQNLVDAIDRGDVDGVSVSMYVLDDDWGGLYNGYTMRRISRAYLDAISFVPRQAYEEAQATLRAKQDYRALKEERLKSIVRPPKVALLANALDLESTDR